MVTYIDDQLLIKSNDMNDIPISTHVMFDILLLLFIILSLLFNILISNVYYRNDHIITHQGVLVITLIVSNLLWTIGNLMFQEYSCLEFMFYFRNIPV